MQEAIRQKILILVGSTDAMTWYDPALIAQCVEAEVLVDHCLEATLVEAKLHLICEPHSTTLEEEHRDAMKSALPPQLFAAVFSNEESDDPLSDAYEQLDQAMLERIQLQQPLLRGHVP